MAVGRKLLTALDAARGIALSLAGICIVIGTAYLVVWLMYLLAGRAG